MKYLFLMIFLASCSDAAFEEEIERRALCGANLGMHQMRLYTERLENNHVFIEGAKESMDVEYTLQTAVKDISCFSVDASKYEVGDKVECEVVSELEYDRGLLNDFKGLISYNKHGAYIRLKGSQTIRTDVYGDDVYCL